MFGTVSSYNPKKKFGYIAGDDGKEYFVHESEIMLPSKCLYAGYSVRFTPTSGFPKPKAAGVCLL